MESHRWWGLHVACNVPWESLQPQIHPKVKTASNPQPLGKLNFGTLKENSGPEPRSDYKAVFKGELEQKPEISTSSLKKEETPQVKKVTVDLIFSENQSSTSVSSRQFELSEGHHIFRFKFEEDKLEDDEITLFNTENTEGPQSNSRLCEWSFSLIA